MSAEFIDSNIFIYLFDETDLAKSTIAQNLVLGALEHGSAVISFQVVQETLNVITRKLKKSASPADARNFFDDVLQPLWRIMPTPAMIIR